MRVEKSVKEYENFMTFVIYVILNRGVLCQDIIKMNGNFGSIIFFMMYQRNITQKCAIWEIFFFGPPYCTTHRVD